MAALCLTVALSPGCMSGGLDIAGGLNVDKSLTTGSIPAKSEAGLSDENTVRDAVALADMSSDAETAIPWANSTSGSAGVINAIAEEQVNGTRCRRFVTTRHSYQGIAKFYGSTCLAGSGQWVMTSFAPRS